MNKHQQTMNKHEQTMMRTPKDLWNKHSKKYKQLSPPDQEVVENAKHQRVHLEDLAGQFFCRLRKAFLDQLVRLRLPVNVISLNDIANDPRGGGLGRFSVFPLDGVFV
jgi:hypothetical protein